MKGLAVFGVIGVLGACNGGGSSGNPTQNLTQEQRLEQLAKNSKWVLTKGNYNLSFNSIDYSFEYSLSIPVSNKDKTSTTGSHYLVGVNLYVKKIVRESV